MVTYLIEYLEDGQIYSDFYHAEQAKENIGEEIQKRWDLFKYYRRTDKELLSVTIQG